MVWKKTPQSGISLTPSVCGNVAKDIWRTARVLSKAKLNNKINLVYTWPHVYTPLFFHIGHVVFVSFMLSLLALFHLCFCVHATTDFSPCAQ